MRNKREPRHASTCPPPPPEAQAILDLDYTYLESYGPTQWLILLTNFYEESIEHHLDLHKLDSATYTLGELDENGEASELMTVQVGTPPVRLIEESPDGLCIAPSELPVLIVDTRAPDGVIHEQIDLALAHLRKRNPPPFPKPGPPATNNRLDRRTFDLWIANKIIALGFLIVWRGKLPDKERKSYKDWHLGEWIWKSKSSPRKTSETIKMLKDAIGQRAALRSQLSTNLPKIELAMLMPHIMRNLRAGTDDNGNPTLEIPSSFELLVAERVKPGD